MSTAPIPRPPSTGNQKKDRTILWTALSLSVVIGVILVLSALDDSQGNPWISESIIGQTLTTLGVVGAAFGPTLLKVRRDTAAVKHEVKNDHPTNYRIEQDVRFDRIIRYFERVENRIEAGFASADRKLDRVNDRLDKHEDRIDGLEGGNGSHR